MCGIIGVIGDPEASMLVYYGLYALQHRGQDAAGIATWDKSKMSLHKELGVVTEVFKTSESLNLEVSIWCRQV